MPTETKSPEIAVVEERQRALAAAAVQHDAAREAFEDALREAHDAGNSYRELAEVVGYGHHYVGDLIKASRSRAA